MANRSCRRQPPRIPVATPLAEPRPAISEPVMRCWPHPVPAAPQTTQTDPMLHYIRCALTYQNEILCEIKTLLEELLVTRDENGAGQ